MFEYTDLQSKMRVGRTYLTTSNLKFNQNLNQVFDSEISVVGDVLVGYQLSLDENPQYKDEE